MMTRCFFVGMVYSALVLLGDRTLLVDDLSAMQAAWRPMTLHAKSPLAVNKTTFFAVANDGATIVRQSLATEGPWEVFKAGAARPVAGLAATDRELYVSYVGSSEISAIEIMTGEARTHLMMGPGVSPSELAFADNLYVADRFSSKLYLIGNNEAVDVTPPFERASASSRHYIASSEQSLLMTSPDEGVVWQASDFGRSPSAPKWAEIQKPSSQSASLQLPVSDDIVTAGEVKYPLRPTVITSNGSVFYVADGNSDNVFASSTLWPRPTRLRYGAKPVQVAAGLVATDQNLFVLDGARGVIERWPRFTPTRIGCSISEVKPSTAPPCSQEQYAALARLFDRLHRERLLPVRLLPPSASGPDAVRAAGFATVSMQRAMTQIACALTPDACNAGQNDFVADGRARSLTVPDVYGESFVDIGPVILDGKNTLGQLADAAVPTPQLSVFAGESRLAQYNSATKTSEPYRDLSKGLASMPIELVRFVVGLPDDQIPVLIKQFPTLRFTALRRSPSQSASIAAQPEPQIPTAEEIRLLDGQKRTGIGIKPGFTPPARNGLMYLGLVEQSVDENHPLLVGFIGEPRSREDESAPAAEDPPSPLQLTVRDFEDDDHGTAVASQIVAVTSQYASGALAAGTQLLPFGTDDAVISEGIRNAYFNHDVRIFNISQAFRPGQEPTSLLDRIKQTPGALFVVAAGNHIAENINISVCSDTFKIYPACLGGYPNVLVVTATTLDGQAILPPKPGKPGANWHPGIVHVAAPGDGFYAAGKSSGYVKVSGSSFSTPLVTATAALLYRQGVTSPWDLKQHIIETADQVDGLKGRVLNSGRLNAARATSTVTHALGVNNQGDELLIELVRPGTEVRFATATTQFVLNLRQIRRLIRQPGNKYWLLYSPIEPPAALDQAQDQTPLRLISTIVDAGNWPVQYVLPNGVRKSDGRLTDFRDYAGPVR
ncbi:MAG: S8 family serine peptidase [Acidobacteriota bacterium]|nr:S8 family serine peptidase [Acidobacteriota bacterium]